MICLKVEDQIRKRGSKEVKVHILTNHLQYPEYSSKIRIILERVHIPINLLHFKEEKMLIMIPKLENGIKLRRDYLLHRTRKILSLFGSWLQQDPIFRKHLRALLNGLGRKVLILVLLIFRGRKE